MPWCIWARTARWNGCRARRSRLIMKPASPRGSPRRPPVIYPFIVNNPGEASVARRRLGAVVLGHLTPPLKAAGTHGAAAALERLIDDYAAADGLDRRRTEMLRDEILTQARSRGAAEESGCRREMPADDQLARLDAYLCDVKELQIRDGLHVFGQRPGPGAAGGVARAIQAAAPNADPARLEAALDASARPRGQACSPPWRAVRAARPGGRPQPWPGGCAAHRPQSLQPRPPRRADPRRHGAGGQSRRGDCCAAICRSRGTGRAVW